MALRLRFETLRCRLRHAHLHLRQPDLGSEVLASSDKTVMEYITLSRSSEYRVDEQAAFSWSRSACYDSTCHSSMDQVILESDTLLS